VPLWVGGVGSPSNTMSLGLRPICIPRGILIHAAVWPQWTWAENLGAPSPPWGGGERGPSNTKSPGPRPCSIPSDILIHAAIWPQQIWAENWGVAPLGRGAGFPSNAMWLGPRPTCMPSFILIRPTVWPQYTRRQTDDTRQTTSHHNSRTLHCNGRLTKRKCK